MLSIAIVIFSVYGTFARTFAKGATDVLSVELSSVTARGPMWVKVDKQRERQTTDTDRMTV